MSYMVLSWDWECFTSSFRNNPKNYPLGNFQTKGYE